MNPVQKKSPPRVSGKKTKKESESDPDREPGDPVKKNRHVKEELPNIGDPLPDKEDKLVSLK